MKKLQQAYNAEDFRKRGHQLIDDLANHFDTTINEKQEKVISWTEPKDERDFWLDFLNEGDENSLFKNVLERSILIHNPKYIGHQVTPTVPITVLSAMVSATLNNGMAVYEMGKVSSAMEKIITNLLCKKIGFKENSNGILTSGGTLANLTALLSARKAILKNDIWQKGNSQKLGIMVSEEAHYCIERAAKIMGLGEVGIIKIPTDENRRMNTSLLENKFWEADANKIEIFAIVASAPATALGMHDDLQAISSFAKAKNIWFHVDGAHGGAAIFSSKYKHLINGIEDADSVVIDGHKMMMMPALTTALLYKNGNHSHATFSQKADYLLEKSEEEDWYNIAKRSFECTKTMMSLHWFTLLKTYGESIFDGYVTTLYDLGHLFGKMVQENPNMELATQPDCNIVCFRFVLGNLSDIELNKINIKIRQEILEEGNFYIVQTKLKGKHFLRVTIMNSFTNKSHFKDLLNLVLRKGKRITSN